MLPVAGGCDKWTDGYVTDRWKSVCCVQGGSSTFAAVPQHHVAVQESFGREADLWWFKLIPNL
jgi:hypothetical protein